MKVFASMGLFDEDFLPWMNSFLNQAAVNWIFCMLVCIAVSLMTARPDPVNVTNNLTINWKKLNIFEGISGKKWYHSILLWWVIFVVIVISLFTRFW
jgi:SSS family solute:Na+ symporter